MPSKAQKCDPTTAAAAAAAVWAITAPTDVQGTLVINYISISRDVLLYNFTCFPPRARVQSGGGPQPPPPPPTDLADLVSLVSAQQSTLYSQQAEIKQVSWKKEENTYVRTCVYIELAILNV